jgi:PKD repeat protein
MINRKKSLRIVGKSLAVCIFLLLAGAAATIGQSLTDYQLTVNTDQDKYYPDETVIVSGALTKDGQGVPSVVIYLKLYNEGGTLIFEDKVMTNSQGEYQLTFALPGVEPGNYNVFVASYQPFYIKAETTLEVVSTTIVANAHGPYNGVAGEPIQFSGDATGGKLPYTWLWNFDDGNTSTQQNPLHSFRLPGQYNVTLTVTAAGGYQGSDTAKATIAPAPNTAPNKPTLTGPTSGDLGVEYTFTVVTTDPEGNDVSYSVDWGDGTNSGWTSLFASGVPTTVKHTWDESGTFTVKAKARDSHLLESVWSDPHTMEIAAPPELNCTLKGGFGVKFIITNTGDVDVQNVSYNVSLKGGIIFRPKQPVTGTVDIPAGSEAIVKVTVIGFLKTEITGEATVQGESVKVTASAFVFGLFVFIR